MGDCLWKDNTPVIQARQGQAWSKVSRRRRNKPASWADWDEEGEPEQVDTATTKLENLKLTGEPDEEPALPDPPTVEETLKTWAQIVATEPHPEDAPDHDPEVGPPATTN